jgi:hypothetical protein
MTCIMISSKPRRRDSSPPCNDNAARRSCPTSLLRNVGSSHAPDLGPFSDFIIDLDQRFHDDFAANRSPREPNTWVVESGFSKRRILGALTRGGIRHKLRLEVPR